MTPTPIAAPSASTPDLVGQLAARMAGGAARAGGDRDTVDGVQPRLVAEPATPDELAAALAWATEERLRVLVTGGAHQAELGGERAVRSTSCSRRRGSPGSSSTATAT